MKIKNVLVSQPAPADYEKSPYKPLATKFGLKFVFRKFIKVEGISATEFRKNKINLLDYTAIIFTSRNAVDHFFRMAKEMRVVIPITMKYFCSSETTAFYLQNYIQYRKRKIFYGKQTLSDLIQLVGRHKEENYLLPCSEESESELPNALAKARLKYTKAPLFRTVPEKIASEIDINDYDLLVFFSPIGIHSLKENYPKFKQGKVLIAAYGDTVCNAVETYGYHVNIAAPTETASSMNQAIEQFLTDYYKAGGDLEKMPAKYTYVPKVKEDMEKEKEGDRSRSKASEQLEAVIERVARTTSKTTTSGGEKRQKVSLHGKTIEVKVAANRAAALAVMEKKKKK
ncbi:MAG: uroporphyrinogen-III synthase [Bacteroidales bacterium]|nr:uroporphyrinogen-III synthase [Bacteroidales bacterium]